VPLQSAIDLSALLDSLERAIAEAASGPSRRVASATVAIEGSHDPSAVAFGSRLAADRWFCWEQPENDGFALAALGSAHEVVARGERRFAETAADCVGMVNELVAHQPPDLPAGAGPVWVGAFAFDPDGGRAAHWSSLEPGLMTLPELSIARRGGRSFLTVNALVQPGTDAAALETARRRLAGLRRAPSGLLDPNPTSRSEIGAPHPPGHFERAVAEATRRIAGGALEKVVLAREVVVTATAAHDPGAVFSALREVFPSCFCFCFGTPEAAFLGASPELLIRRRGAVAATVALAGSTRRSADPAVDAHLGEQLLRSDKDREEHAIVARRIERTLRSHAVWVQPEPEPGLAQVANIQHLATPIHAQLTEARSAVELAGLLHPTPAVGGEPRDRAVELIAELEGIDRGLYAGPVGWMDATADGEFCVGLRSALLRDRDAHLYAGCGIVADSDPAAELAESELKLDALLPLLTA
jgi:menaquinone-specific isochorismate synthase